MKFLESKCVENSGSCFLYLEDCHISSCGSYPDTNRGACCSNAAELYSAWTLATFTMTFIGCSQSI